MVCLHVTKQQRSLTTSLFASFVSRLCAECKASIWLASVSIQAGSRRETAGLPPSRVNKMTPPTPPKCHDLHLIESFPVLFC